mgnify:CR=1 FL=1
MGFPYWSAQLPSALFHAHAGVGMTSDIKGRALLGNNAYKQEVVYLDIRNGGNIVCLAAPRYGKGALCKPLAVQVSKFKKVCIFDYKGEWAAHITQYNSLAQYPERLVDFFIADNFAFAITDFNQVGDWVGFGFQDDAAQFMYKIVRSIYHNGEIDRIREMIKKLPVRDDDVDSFNSDYGTDLLVAIHTASKGALGRRFEVVQRFFWTGVSDVRQRLDFWQLWRDYKHLIIDLSDRRDGFRDIGKARAYAGLILRQMSITFDYTQGFFVIEEGSQLLANLERLADGSVVGYSEFHKLVERLVTLSPKQGVNLLILAQSRRQLYTNILVYLPIQLIGRLNPLDDLTEFEKGLNEQLRVYPGTGRREWWLVDTFYNLQVKFVAALPCCGFETNR